MSLVVKRFKELIRLVDQLLNALTRGVRRLARKQRPYHGERKRRGKTRNADPNQRARQVRIALLLRLCADFVTFLGVRRVRQVTPLSFVSGAFGLRPSRTPSPVR